MAESGINRIRIRVRFGVLRIRKVRVRRFVGFGYRSFGGVISRIVKGRWKVLSRESKRFRVGLVRVVGFWLRVGKE